MAEKLEITGRLREGEKTVLFIPGGMASAPAVYDGIGKMIPWQSAVIDWSNSKGPWDILELGNRTLDLIRQMNLGKVILAGYSAGGVIAMQAAAEDKEGRIGGLLLSNTGPCTIGHGDPELPDRIRKQWFSMELFEPFLSRCFAFPIEPLLKKTMIEYASKIPMEVVYQAAKTLREYDLRPRLKEISCPVVIAHGKLDTTRTLKHVEMMQEGIADVEINLLNGGHTIMAEDREHWVLILNKLIQKVERAME